MEQATERARHQRPRLSVDFVTALSLDECHERLREAADLDSLNLMLREDGGFALRRPPSSDSGRDVRFWGTLEEVERGTWVWGAILEDVEDDDGDDHVTPLRAFVVVLLLFMAAEALLRDDLRMVAFWAGTLVFLTVVAGLVWRRRYRYGLEVVDWIYRTLYLPPPKGQKSGRERQ